jgi:hypothetical protein
MTFTLNAEVAAVLAAAVERSGPPPAPPFGDIASRRVPLDAMLRYFNNQAQPIASKVDISDHSVVTPTGPRCSRGGTASRRARAGRQCCTCTAAG